MSAQGGPVPPGLVHTRRLVLFTMIAGLAIIVVDWDRPPMLEVGVMILFVTGITFELYWRRVLVRATSPRESLARLAAAAEQADPRSILTLIEAFCSGNGGERRLAAIALENIGDPAVELLVVRAEHAAGELLAELLVLLGRLTGRPCDSLAALAGWWPARRLHYQAAAATRWPPQLDATR